MRHTYLLVHGAWHSAAHWNRVAEHLTARGHRVDAIDLPGSGLDARYPHGHPLRDEALPRLEEELGVIRHLGLSGFFILHRDLLELAREVALEVRGPSVARSMLPPGRGRGSSAAAPRSIFGARLRTR